MEMVLWPASSDVGKNEMRLEPTAKADGPPRHRR